MMDNINAFLPLINQLKASVKEQDTKDYLYRLLKLIKDILDILSDYNNHSKTSKLCKPLMCERYSTTNLGFYMRHWINSKKATFDGLQKRVDAMRKNINSYLQAKMERNTTEIRK